LGEQGADGGGGVSTRIVALLRLAAFINYVDRGSLATVVDRTDWGAALAGRLLPALPQG